MHFCDSVHPPEFVKTRRNKSTHNFHTLPPRMHPKALIFPSENFLSFSSARKIFVLVRSLSSILFRSLLGENTKICERTPLPKARAKPCERAPVLSRCEGEGCWNRCSVDRTTEGGRTGIARGPFVAISVWGARLKFGRKNRRRRNHHRRRRRSAVQHPPTHGDNLCCQKL